MNRVYWLIWVNSFLLFTSSSFCFGKNPDLKSLMNEQQVTEAVFLSIKDGVSLEGVRKTLGLAARHEFTILTSNETYTLVGCYVGKQKVFQWLLFCNDVLVKRPPWIWHGQQPFSADGNMARVWEVIKARSMTLEESKSDFAPLPKDKRTAGEPMNILPALLLAWPLMKLSEPRLERKFLLNRDLRKRFDGCRVSPGMTAAQTDGMFGKPYRTYKRDGGGSVRLYGSDDDLEEIGREYRFSPVAVVFNEKEMVVRVFSDMFFDDDWKKTSEPETAKQ